MIYFKQYLQKFQILEKVFKQPRSIFLLWDSVECFENSKSLEHKENIMLNVRMVETIFDRHTFPIKLTTNKIKTSHGRTTVKP